MAHQIWRLPAGVDEVLPPLAWRLEALRRGVLDLFHGWGYDYVEPPVIEYLDALLVGNDLNLQTLKVADQVSGRTLGVRADITSQAARIDANSLGGESVTRLCYAGPTVLARAPGVMESRVPLKAGAELYGSAELAADIEVLCLALDALALAGLESPVVELGHVGFVETLVAPLQLSEALYAELMDAVRIKSEADVRSLLRDGAAARRVADDLCQLVQLMGGREVLNRARDAFADAHPVLLDFVTALERCAEQLSVLRPHASLRFDVSEPVGFGYHKALVFALYDREHGQAVARGGRYDGIGEQFGRGRPATGFDMNLKPLASMAEAADLSAQNMVWIPWQIQEQDRTLADRAATELRAAGHRVCFALHPADTPAAACRSVLVLADGAWQLQNRE